MERNQLIHITVDSHSTDSLGKKPGQHRRRRTASQGSESIQRSVTLPDAISNQRHSGKRQQDALTSSRFGPGAAVSDANGPVPVKRRKSVSSLRKSSTKLRSPQSSCQLAQDTKRKQSKRKTFEVRKIARLNEHFSFKSSQKQKSGSSFGGSSISSSPLASLHDPKAHGTDVLDELVHEIRNHKEASRRRKDKERGEKLPQQAMERLGLEFDRFDAESRTQMFIEKESNAPHSAAGYSSSFRGTVDQANDLLGSVDSQEQVDSEQVQIREIFKVLDKPPGSRAQAELETILPFFKKLPAFEKLCSLNAADGGHQLPDSFYHKILQVCQIQNFANDEFVMKEGEKGQTFYIILKGVCAFYKNNTEKTAALIQEVQEQTLHGSQLKDHQSIMHLNKSLVQSDQVVTITEGEIKNIPKTKMMLSKYETTPASITTPVNQQAAVSKLQMPMKGVSMRGHYQSQDNSSQVANSPKTRALSQNTIAPFTQQYTGQAMVSKVQSSAEPTLVGQQTIAEESSQINVVVMREVNRMRRGEMFGQLAIHNPDKGRACSVKAVGPSILMILTAKDYNRYMKRSIEKMEENKINFMRNTLLFKDSSKALVRNAFTMMHKVHLDKGQTVVKQATPNSHLFFIQSGQVEVSIRIKKPHSDPNQASQLLRQEKYKLKDQIHGIVRHTAASLEASNCVIEGDDTGMMGATNGWPKIPFDADQYKERLENARIRQEENELRRRMMQVSGKAEDAQAVVGRQANDKRDFCVVDHVLTRLSTGQSFGEEGVSTREALSKYSVRVVSHEGATLWKIDEFQFNRKLNQLAEIRRNLGRLMQAKAKLVYDQCRVQHTWSLIEAETFATYYIECFSNQNKTQKALDKAAADHDESAKVTNNKHSLAEQTRVFFRQFDGKQDRYSDEVDPPKVSMSGVNSGPRPQGGSRNLMQARLDRNMELLHAKMDQMDQIQGIVQMHPLQRTFMPQMNNKKRYYEVQTVVSPNKQKGQKPYKMFTEDSFMQEAQVIPEAAPVSTQAIQGQMSQKRVLSNLERAMNRSKSGVKTKAVPKGLVKYDRQLHQLQNIHGGASMINSRTFDHRKVLEEIVKGYPMVQQQREMYLRQQALSKVDSEGKPLHKTPQMLLSEKGVDEQTAFEQKLFTSFDESPDPMQLIKILKRKLSINDPVNGPQYIAVLEEMLQKEPLRKFVLFAKKCYFSDQIFKEIAQMQALKGNEKEVFKNDPEYQTYISMKQKKDLPKKTSYFQQQLRLKQEQALLYEWRRSKAAQSQQARPQSTYLNIDNGLYLERQQTFMSSGGVSSLLKYDATTTHGQNTRPTSQIEIEPTRIDSDDKAPLFESQELRTHYPYQHKAIAKPLQSRFTVQSPKSRLSDGQQQSDPAFNLAQVVQQITVRQQDRSSMGSPQPGGIGPRRLDGGQDTSMLLSEGDGKGSGTARITYQGEKESLGDVDEGGIGPRIDPLDVPIVRADIKVVDSSTAGTIRGTHRSKMIVQTFGNSGVQELQGTLDTNNTDRTKTKITGANVADPVSLVDTRHPNIQRPSTSVLQHKDINSGRQRTILTSLESSNRKHNPAFPQQQPQVIIKEVSLLTNQKQRAAQEVNGQTFKKALQQQNQTPYANRVDPQIAASVGGALNSAAFKSTKPSISSITQQAGIQRNVAATAADTMLSRLYELRDQRHKAMLQNGPSLTQQQQASSSLGRLQQQAYKRLQSAGPIRAAPYGVGVQQGRKKQAASFLSAEQIVLGQVPSQHQTAGSRKVSNAKSICNNMTIASSTMYSRTGRLQQASVGAGRNKKGSVLVSRMQVASLRRVLPSSESRSFI